MDNEAMTRVFNHLLVIITWGKKTQKIQSVQMAGRPTTRQKLRL